MNKPAVFIDRDGTISEEVGYVNHPSRFQLFPYSAEAIRLLNQNNFLVILVTNQSGVARGYFPESMVRVIHERLGWILEDQQAKLDGIYYCTHHPSIGSPPYRLDCDCRKPKPGLINEACNDFEIDLNSSWLIGDRFRDVEMARNAGIRSALVLTGYGRGEWEYQRSEWASQPDLVCENLLEAVKSIIARSNRADDSIVHEATV